MIEQTYLKMIEDGDIGGYYLLARHYSQWPSKFDIAEKYARTGVEKGCIQARFILTSIAALRARVLTAELKAALVEEFDTNYQLAKQGDCYSQYIVANFYTLGTLGIVKNDQMAYKWAKKSYQGDCLISFDLLCQICCDLGNFEEAFNLAIEAIKKGSQNVYGILYELYLNGFGTNQDTKKAIKYLRLGVERENTHLMRILANYHLRGTYVRKNIPLALELLNRAADLGNDFAMVELGSIYRDGEFVQTDLELSKSYYLKALPYYNFDAIDALGSAYMEGHYGTVDLKKAEEYFLMGHRLGNHKSTINLAIVYTSLEPANQNQTKAFQLYSSLAHLYPIARFRVYTCYLNGIGVTKDREKAHEQLLLAAKEDFPPALYLLAQCHLEKEIKGANKKEGMKLMHQAMEADDIMALSYFAGLGDEKHMEYVFRIAKLIENPQYLRQNKFYYGSEAVDLVIVPTLLSARFLDLVGNLKRE